ncbi:hypothetical protein [Halodesulfovibrio marinisediminis]|uniref:hypothetical protein n=1 Tax=Halodesulfovibrio marinisediminis TaxID=458711 RepID=UPI0009415EA7|nr:hypothetical protein [Halodesulfovibrio marinisediminis]
MEQQTAVGALVGCALCLGFIGILMNGITLTRFAVFYVSLVCMTIGMILRRQQRTIEVSVADNCIYFVGRRKNDVYAIPFGLVAALRLTRRNTNGELVEPGFEPGENSKGRYPYHLDLVLRTSGYETLDRSVLGPDLAAIALRIAEVTGFAIEDHAGIGFSRTARTEYEPIMTDVEECLPDDSALQAFSVGGRKGFSWTFSPGNLYIVLMVFAVLGMLYGGGFGVWKVVKGEGNVIAGGILLFVCGFFAYRILWRLICALTGKGFIVWDGETVCYGSSFFGKEFASVMLERRDIEAICIAVPRPGKGHVEIVQSSGALFTTLNVSSPLAPLTAGDLHWFSRYLRKQLSVSEIL